MLSSADKIHLAIIWTLDICVIVTNLLLITAIVLRVIENHFEISSIFVFLGPCSLISERICRLAHALLVNLVQHSTIVLLLSFAYRLYILSDLFPSRPPPSRAKIWLLCSLSLLIIAPLTVGYYLEEWNLPDEIQMRFHLEEYSTANFNILHTWALLVNNTGCLISPIVMTAIFVVRRKLIAQTAQSKATDKRHHEFIARALTYQIMLPCAAAIGVFFWILNLSQIWSSEFSERLIMGMFSVFSLASPFINFTLLPPYRALLPFSRTQTLKDVAVAPLDFTTTIL